MASLPVVLVRSPFVLGAIRNCAISQISPTFFHRSTMNLTFKASPKIVFVLGVVTVSTPYELEAHKHA